MTQADLRMAALYAHDARGRILLTNEWDARPAPRFALFRMQTTRAWRVGALTPEEIALELGAIVAREPAGHDAASPVLAGELCAALEAPESAVRAGPVFRFPAALPDAACVSITAANADLLRHGLDAWVPDVLHRRPFVAVCEAGEAIAVCASVRISDALHEAGVETRADKRGRGYGAAAVAGWARLVRALGAEPVYSTSWENAASRGLARRLGLAQIGADFSIA